MAESIILSSADIALKTKRMAVQIIEQNLEANKIILAGIVQEGFKLAQILKSEIEKRSQIEVLLISVTLAKYQDSQPEVFLDNEISTLEEAVVILVDDVLNSGRTLAYALKPFLEIKLQKLQVAVLVNRAYSRFPIAPDYVGLSLATTMKEHILVKLNADGSGQAILT